MEKEVKNQVNEKKPQGQPKEKSQGKVKKVKDKDNLEVVKEVIVKKVLKYKYPKGLLDPQKRKSYRQKVRNNIERAELRVVRAKGSKEIKEAKEALVQLKEKYLSE